MFKPTPLLTTLSLASIVAAANPPAFLLAGDSTTASGAGWGDAFLAQLTNDSTGTNYAVSGKSTISYGSQWEDILAGIAEAVEGNYDPYVTIQFGHNDQKSQDALDVYVENIQTWVEQARSAGATPLIFSSLTRRNFNDSDPPQVEDDLANVRELAVEAAEGVDADYADLNTRSREYVNAIGQDNAETYNYDGTDSTHLNEKGGIVFAVLVGQLVVETFLDLADYISVDAELADALTNGEYYYPS